MQSNLLSIMRKLSTVFFLVEEKLKNHFLEILEEVDAQEY